MAKSLYIGSILDRQNLSEIKNKLEALHAKSGKDYYISQADEFNEKWLINIFNKRFLIASILDRTIAIRS